MSNKKNYFVDIHAIQGVPANNLNRDETNSPKTMTFRGTRRFRVSSQAWKKAQRDWVRENLTDEELAIRSMNVPELLVEAIQNASGMSRDEAVNLMKKAMGKIQIEENTDNDSSVWQTKSLFFLGKKQIENIAGIMLNDELDDKDKAALTRTAMQQEQPVDLALFGRMVADNPLLNVDSAVEYAHAMGVTKAIPEFDFYTAMDDYNLTGHAGAANMGTVEFGSSVFYRYATISLSQLEDNLGSIDAVKKAIGVFLKSFVYSMPSGKQNSFSARTLPDAVVVTIREGRGVPYSEAFDIPIESKGEGSDQLIASMDRMTEYAKSIESAYGMEPVASFVMHTKGESINELGNDVSFPELVDDVTATVGEVLSDNNEQSE